MSLKINAESADQSVLHLSLEGQLDTTTAVELESFARERVGPAVRTLVLDLEQLSFVSSAGLRVFAKLRRTLSAQGGKLYFIKLSPQVTKVFKLVKAVPLNEVFANTQELDDYLANMQQNP